MVVSSFWLGTKVDPSIKIFHICQQTKRSLQLQAMLSCRMNKDISIDSKN